MRVLRFLGNLLLAVVLVVLSALVLLTGFGLVISRAWEDAAYDDGVEGGAWVDVEKQPIYYRIWEPEQGSSAVGGTLVLVHGLDVEGLQTWNSNAQALANSGFTVVALDLKGFGHSARDSSPTYTLRGQATLVARVLEQLKVTKATVVGHGWGCAVALQLASEYPQLVQRLVLLAPQVYRDPLAFYRPVIKVQYVGPYLGRALAWAMTSGDPFWTWLRRRGFHDQTVVTSSYLNEIRQPTHVTGTIAALLAMAASPREDVLPKTISAIKAPTLILLGQEDIYVPSQEAKRLESALPGSKLVILPEAGHYVHIERSTDVNRAITQFSEVQP